MKTRLKLLLIFNLIYYFSFSQRPLEIFVDLPGPYTQDLASYDLSSGKYTITIFNHTTVPQSINFRAELKGLENGVLVRIGEEDKPIKPFIIPPQEFYLITKSELDINYNNLNVDNLELKKISPLDKNLPPGNYELCVVAFDFNTNVQLSIGCSVQFTIENSSLLNLVSPFNNDEVSSNIPLNFLWEINDITRPQDMQYTLEVIDLYGLDSQDYEALFSQVEPKFFAIDGLNSLNYNWGNGPLPEADSFIIGHKYAWRVKITDVLNLIEFQNGGYSQIYTFTYGNLSIDDNNLDESFPEDCASRCNIPLPSNSIVSSLGNKTYIKSGFFTISNLEVSENNGFINGRGVTKINFLNNLKVIVSIENVKINDDGKVLEGIIKGIPDENDPTLKSIIKELGLDKINQLIPGSTDFLLQLIPKEKQNQIGDAIRNAHMIQSFVNGDIVGLPLGLSQKFDNGEVTIGITGLELYPTGAKCKIVTGFKMDIGNQMNWYLALGDSICIAPNGFGGEYMIGLGEDISIGASNESESFDIVFKGGGNNVAERCFFQMDCNGLKKVGIHGELGIPRDLIIPVNAEAKQIDGKVKGKFAFNFENKNQAGSNLNSQGGIQLLVGIDLPRFQIKGMDGWAIEIKKAWLDLHDTINPPGIIFPENYGSTIQQFKGIYIEKISMNIPKEFLNDTTKKIEIDHLIIDPHLYAKASITNILKLDGGGSLSGFGFSIDKFGLSILNNDLEDVFFEGIISLPINKEGEGLEYKAKLVFDSNSKPIFGFNVRPPQNGMKIPMMFANASISPNSYLNVNYDDSKQNGQKVDVKFGLYGDISINTDSLKVLLPNNATIPELPVKLSLPKLEFSLVYNSKITNGFIKDSCIFGFSSPSKTISGLPLNIKKLGLEFEGLDKIGLACELEVVLIDGPNDIAANTKFIIWSKVNPTSNNIAGKIAFESFEIKGIDIDANFNSISIKGKIEFYSEPIVGNLNSRDRGVKGNVTVGLPIGLLNIEAQFGVYGEPRTADIFAFTNDYFAYFRLAGTLMFNPGLPLGVPPYQLPFDLYGFGGGIHYNMLPTISEPINGSIGDGATYKPQFGSFGFQASVILGSKADPTPMNGKVTFGATMSMNRGLEQLSVIGELYLMTNINNWSKPKIKAVADFRLNFYPELELVGSFLGYVKIEIPEQNPIVSMVGNMGNKRDGTMITGSMRLSQNENFLRFGRPRMNINGDDPRGRLTLDATLLGKGIQANEYMYLMAGDGVPIGLPPLPKRVQDLFKTKGINFESEPLKPSSIGGSGLGFAVGAQIELDADISFPGLEEYLSFSFEGDIGFDFNISKYSNVRCTNTNSEIGLNGYYALGQAYIAVNTSAKIDLKLDDNGNSSLYKKEFSAQIAAYVDGGFPNPFYINGQLVIDVEIPVIDLCDDCKDIAFESFVSLLQAADVDASYEDGNTGLSVDDISDKFSMSMQFNLGEKCQIKTNSGQIVGNEPLVISSNPTQNQQDIALNKEILIQFNYNSGNNTVVSLDQNMKEIRNILKFDIIKAELFENNTSILIRNNLSTRGTKQITINYSDLFKPNTNYKLKLSLKLSKASQTLKVETFELSFRTQSKPENLSPYVKMTIPENQNFYIQENNKKGFIFFDSDISTLYPQDKNHQYFIIISNNVDKNDTISAKYLAIGADGPNFNYDLPELGQSKKYSITLIDKFITNKSTKQFKYQELFTYKFGTSKYKTLAQKIESISFEKIDTEKYNAANDYIVTISIGEPLDNLDLNNNTAKIVFAESFDNAYFENFTSNYNIVKNEISNFENLRFEPNKNIHFRYNAFLQEKIGSNKGENPNNSGFNSNFNLQKKYHYTIKLDAEKNQYNMRKTLYEHYLNTKNSVYATLNVNAKTNWKENQLDMTLKNGSYKLNIFPPNSNTAIKSLEYLKTQ